MNIGFESEIIEFKKSTAELKQGIISISSILNKHGSGILYFGVNDNGEVKGQTVGKETQRDISRAISSYIKPECHYEINLQHTAEGLQFIEVDFSGNEAPYSAYGKYYQRFADEDKTISDIELERLFKERNIDYSQWENDLSKETIEDADDELIESVIDQGNDSGHLKYQFTDKKTTLKRFGLLASDSDKLNNAGRVLFSKNAPVLLKVATFATKTKSTFIKLDHYRGNIFECIEYGIDYITSGISYVVDFNGQASRSERSEIPLSAIREIVVNAFAHGSYDSNTAFEIDIFADRVVIYSPGSFPRGYKPEDFATQKERPIMLNPKINEVLFRTGMIESFGSGFERTFEECEKASVRYSYRNLHNGFEFVFERPHGHINVHDMSKTEAAVLEELKKNNYATAKQIATVIGKSEKTVYRAFKRLKELQKITRTGDDYNGSWTLID